MDQTATVRHLDGLRCLHLYRRSLVVKVQKSSGEWVIDRIPAPPEGRVIVGWPYGETLHFSAKIEDIDALTEGLVEEVMPYGDHETRMVRLTPKVTEDFYLGLLKLSRAS